MNVFRTVPTQSSGRKGVFASVLVAMLKKQRVALARALVEAGGGAGPDVEKGLDVLAKDLEQDGAGALLPPKKLWRKLMAIGKAAKAEVRAATAGRP